MREIDWKNSLVSVKEERVISIGKMEKRGKGGKGGLGEVRSGREGSIGR